MSNELNSLDIKEIMDLLPHRYPFLLIDRVIDYVPGKTLHGIKNVSFNEPQFTGHFPGTPVFPGVMILEALAQATGVLAFATYGKPAENELYFLASIDQVRFRKPVVPGDVAVEFIVQSVIVLIRIKHLACAGHVLYPCSKIGLQTDTNHTRNRRAQA